MPHLKKRVNVECNAFIEFLEKEANDHHVEAKGNQFCQFINDGSTLKNKYKHKDFEIQI